MNILNRFGNLVISKYTTSHREFTGAENDISTYGGHITRRVHAKRQFR